MRKLLALIICFFTVALPSFAQGATGSTLSPQRGPLSYPTINYPNTIPYRWPLSVSTPNAYNTFTSGAISFTIASQLTTGGGGPIYTTMPAGIAYTISDISGALIVPQTLIGGTPALPYTLTPPAISKYGWYELRLFDPNLEPTNFAGNARGWCLFNYEPSDARYLSAPAYSWNAGNLASDPGDISACPGMHGCFDTGPMRLAFPERTTTAAAQADANAYLADLNTDLTAGWCAMTMDSVRPHLHLASFPNFSGSAQDIANVTACAAILGTQVAYIGYNEPQSAYTPSAFAALHAQFVAAVHAGAPGAKILGPSIVGFNLSGGLQTWLNSFLALSPHLDGLSIHLYNTVQGDEIWEGEQSLPALKTTMSNNGYGSTPIWCDEVGMACGTNPDGLYKFRRQAAQAVRQAGQMEMYGIPHQQQSWFYDISHGFWTFPTFSMIQQNITTGVTIGQTNQDCLPSIPALRVLSQQTWGATPVGALNLGNAGDYVKAYQWSNASGYVTQLFTSGLASINCTVSGATSAVDIWGNSVSVAGGNLTLTDLPIYVTSTTALSVTDIGNGLMTATNIATTATPTVTSGASLTILSRVNDNLLNSGYYDPSNLMYSDTNNIMPITLTLTWGSGQTVKRIGVLSGRPFQSQSAALAYTIDAFVAGTWQNGIANYTAPTADSVSTSFANMGTGCNFESFTAGTWQQHFVLPTALTNVTAIRYNLTAATWGNDPDYDSAHVSNAPYTWQGSPPHLTMDDLRVYSN